MRNLLLLFIVSCLTIVSYSQNKIYSQPVSIEIFIGYEDLGYPQKTDIVGDDPGEKLGTRCPALMRYVNNKKDYIGGVMYDENNDTATIIVDIQVDIYEYHSIFTVYGEDFNCSITTNTGHLLDIKSDSVIFAEVEGNSLIWKITKNKL